MSFYIFAIFIPIDYDFIPLYQITMQNIILILLNLMRLAFSLSLWSVLEKAPGAAKKKKKEEEICCLVFV